MPLQATPRKPGLAPGSVHMGFVVGEVELGQVLLRVLRFSPVSVIPPGLHTRISSGGRTTGLLVFAVQRLSLTGHSNIARFDSQQLRTVWQTCELLR
jgi:hypothetical protein